VRPDALVVPTASPASDYVRDIRHRHQEGRGKLGHLPPRLLKNMF